MRDQIRSTCNSLLRIEQPSAYSKSAWLPAAFWFSTLHRGTRSDLPMGLFFIVAGACTAMPLRPSLGRRITLTDEQLAAYDRDGVVLVKGVLTGRKLQRAQAAARRVIPSNIPSKARRTSIAQGSSHSHNPTAPQPHSPTDPQTHRPTAPQPHSHHCSTTSPTAQPPLQALLWPRPSGMAQQWRATLGGVRLHRARPCSAGHAPASRRAPARAKGAPFAMLSMFPILLLGTD